VLEFSKPKEFVYYTDNVGKCRCYYKIVLGVSRRISKVAFDLLRKTLPVKVRRGKVFYDDLSGFKPGFGPTSPYYREKLKKNHKSKG